MATDILKTGLKTLNQSCFFYFQLQHFDSPGDLCLSNFVDWCLFLSYEHSSVVQAACGSHHSSTQEGQEEKAKGKQITQACSPRHPSSKPRPEQIIIIFVRMLQGLVERLISVSMSLIWLSSQLDFFFVIHCPPSKSLTQMIILNMYGEQ